MRILLCSLAALTLVLTACASATKHDEMSALWNKYHKHCSAHAVAEATAGSPDEDTLYRECMNYFIKEDVKCSYCVVEK